MSGDTAVAGGAVRQEEAEWSFEVMPAAGRVRLAGELRGVDAPALEARLAGLGPWPSTVRLDLEGLELLDGGAAVAAVNLVRRLRAVAARVVVWGAPQAVGHSLYRVGMLQPGSGVSLEGMREDEAYG